MSKTYTVHFELTDGTLCDAHFSTDSLRVAREVASTPMSSSAEESGIARTIINKKGMTIAAYPVEGVRA